MNNHFIIISISRSYTEGHDNLLTLFDINNLMSKMYNVLNRTPCERSVDTMDVEQSMEGF